MLDIVSIQFMVAKDDGTVQEEGLPHVVVIEFLDSLRVANHEHRQVVENEEVVKIKEENLLCNVIIFFEIRI